MKVKDKALLEWYMLDVWYLAWSVFNPLPSIRRFIYSTVTEFGGYLVAPSTWETVLETSIQLEDCNYVVSCKNVHLSYEGTRSGLEEYICCLKSCPDIPTCRPWHLAIIRGPAFSLLYILIKMNLLLDINWPIRQWINMLIVIEPTAIGSYWVFANGCEPY